MTQSYATSKWFVGMMVIGLLVSISSAVEFAGGTGEPNDPYQIATAEQLCSINSDPNLLDKHFVLVADIDLDPNLPGGRVFDKAVIAPRPFTRSTTGTVFCGVFDGNDHSILNMTIQGVDYLGLFGGISGSVKNLRLAGVAVSGSGHHVAGLVGYSAGDIIESSSAGTVAGTYYVGGLVGTNSGTVTQCGSDGDVTGGEWVGCLVGHNTGHIAGGRSDGSVTGIGRVGGLVGYSGGDIIESSSTGTVAGTYHIGGLVGSNLGTVARCDSDGGVTGGELVGCLVGLNAGSISTSHSAGAVMGYEYVGGLVGDNIGSVIASHSTSSVAGSKYVGGFAGHNWAPSYYGDVFTDWSSASIAESYSTGAVTGISCVGGFVGRNFANIADSYSTGQVNGTEKDVGGFAGVDTGLVVSCFWDIESSGMATSSAGTGKTTAEMQDIETFLAAWWDFVGETDNGACDYWQMSSGEYPQLCCDGYNDSVCCSDPLQPEGSGTAEDPYLIRDARDLSVVWFQPEAHYRLEASIDLSGSTWSTAVIPSFEGSFDGNGYVVSNLYIQGDHYLGLFGRLNSDAVVFNLRLEAVDIVGTGDCVGGLVGYNQGNILSSCCAGSNIAGGRCIGGLAGCNEGNITASCSAGTVTGTEEYDGASAGDNGTRIWVGEYPDPVGSYVGGLVGINYGGIAASYSSSAVSGTGRGIGGLVGYHTGNIVASYCSGAVDGGGYMVGGLVGWGFGGHVTASFWNVETSGRMTSEGGTGLTTAQMQTAAVFIDAGWDFAAETSNGTCDFWQISAGDYPRLCYAGGKGPVMPEGLGTAKGPYLIRDARDLGTVWFQPAAHYRLEASIDLSGTAWSTPVVPWFGGAFEGNGHVISNLHIQGYDYLGLFGKSGSEGVIANLGLEAADVNGTGNHVGALVGCNSGRVNTSSSSGTIRGTRFDVGGLIGRNLGSVTASYSTGTITGSNSVGGLIGFSNGGVVACYSTGTTTGTMHVGGLVGYNYDSGRIATSYSTGVVAGDWWVGGLVGDNLGKVGTSYSTGLVTGNVRVGGLVGSTLHDDHVTASFWDVETSGQTESDGGTGLTTAQMQTAATFVDAGWDFESTWTICEGVDYPRLRWEGVECEDGL